MDRLNFLLVLYCIVFFQTPIFSSQVIKVGADNQLVGITTFQNENIEIGDKLCIYRARVIVMCGTVLKIGDRVTIIKLNEPTIRVLKGDQVASYDVAMEKVRGGFKKTRNKDVVDQFQFGIQGGINRATGSATPDVRPEYSSRLALVAGLSFEYSLSKELSLGAMLQYIEKGPKQVSDSSETILRLDYIELPLWVKARFLEGTVHPYIFAGPSIGYLLIAVADVISSGTVTRRVELKSLLSSIDIAVNVGAGIEIKLSDKMSGVLALRYALGLSNIIKDATGSISFKNNGLQFLTGVLFEI